MFRTLQIGMRSFWSGWFSYWSYTCRLFAKFTSISGCFLSQTIEWWPLKPSFSSSLFRSFTSYSVFNISFFSSKLWTTFQCYKSGIAKSSRQSGFSYSAWMEKWSTCCCCIFRLSLCEISAWINGRLCHAELRGHNARPDPQIFRGRARRSPCVPLLLFANSVFESHLLALCAAAIFGVVQYGSHVNGYVVDAASGEWRVWLGHRALNKPTYPGKLDQMVQYCGVCLKRVQSTSCCTAAGAPRAGGGRSRGRADGVGVRAEGVSRGGLRTGSSSPAAASRYCCHVCPVTLSTSRLRLFPSDTLFAMRPLAPCSYCLEDERGVMPEVEFVFDLCVPASFTPKNADGEVAAFSLVSIEQVLLRIWIEHLSNALALAALVHSSSSSSPAMSSSRTARSSRSSSSSATALSAPIQVRFRLVFVSLRYFTSQWKSSYCVW